MPFSPVLARVLDLARAHALEVETSVFGAGVEDFVLPSKKQQQQAILQNISNAWGEFPEQKGEIQRLISNFNLLPIALKTSLLHQALLKKEDEVQMAEPIAMALDLFLAMLVSQCFERIEEKKAGLFEQIQARILSLQEASRARAHASAASKWYWMELDAKLTRRCIQEWTKFLPKLLPSQASALLTSLHASCALDFIPNATVFCLKVSSKLRVHCLLALLQRASDVMVKRDVLEAIIHVLLENNSAAAAQEFDMQFVVDVLNQKYPPADLKPALRQLECWFRCHNRELTWDTFRRDFALKRICKPFRQQIAVSLELCTIVFRGRAAQPKPHIASFIMEELFPAVTSAESRKKLWDSIEYVDLLSSARALAELCCQVDAMLVLAPLLIKPKPRILLGLLTLRLLLSSSSRQREEDYGLIDSVVVPHFLSIESVPKRGKGVKPAKLGGSVKRTQEEDAYFAAYWQQQPQQNAEDEQEEIALELLCCMDLFQLCHRRISCDLLVASKFPMLVRRHCIKLLCAQAGARKEFALEILRDLKRLVIGARGQNYTLELMQVLASSSSAAARGEEIHRELGPLALALAALTGGNYELAFELNLIPRTSAKLSRDELVSLVFNSDFAKECAAILHQWSSNSSISSGKMMAEEQDAQTTCILLACDASLVPVETLLFSKRVGALEDLQVCAAAARSTASMLNLLHRVAVWFKLPHSSSYSSTPSTTSTLLATSNTPSSFAAATLRTSLRFATNAAAISSSSTSAGVVPSSSSWHLPEEYAEEMVLLRVTAQVLLGSKDAAAVTELEQSVIEAAVECINLVLGRFAGRTRRAPVPTLLVLDLCAIVGALCQAISIVARFANQVDLVWKRVDRRILWIFLRRLSGYEERAVVSTGECRDAVETAAIRLLSIGPVSLGRISEPPDQHLFSWILASPSLARAFLSAHFVSVVEYYVGKCLGSHHNKEEPHVARLLVAAIQACIREFFGIDFSRGRMPRDTHAVAAMVQVSPSLRIHLLALALMMPRKGIVSERDLGDLLCIALAQTPGEMEEIFLELSSILLAPQTSDMDVLLLSRWCAKHGNITSPLAHGLVELLWTHDCIELSLPWLAKLAHSAAAQLFDRAWDLPKNASVWKAFPNRLAAMRYIVSKSEVLTEEASRCRYLLAQVASVATCREILVVVKEQQGSLRDELVFEDALVMRGLDLLRHAAFESPPATDFVLLGNYAFAGEENAFTLEYLRFVHTLEPGMRMDGGEKKESVLDWTLSILVQHVAEQALSEWLDSTLNALDCEGDNGDLAKKARLVRLYCALKKNGVRAQVVMRRGRGELAIVLQACKEIGEFQAFQIHVERECDALPVLERTELLQLVLRYLGEIWRAVPVLYNDALERSAVLLFSPDMPARVEGEEWIFWVAFERLLRLHPRPPAPDLYYLLSNCLANTSVLRDAMHLFEAGEEKCNETALQVCFQVGKETQNEALIRLVFENSAASEYTAHTCAKEIMLSTFAYSPQLIHCAAALLQRFPTAPPSIPDDAVVSSFPYVGPRAPSDALARAHEVWTAFFEEHKTALGSSAATATASSPPLLLPIRQPEPSRGAATVGPPVDVRDALTSRGADVRSRLIAHALDRGYDPAWLDLFEQSSYIPGGRLEAERESLWQSFQRSRWWLFQDASQDGEEESGV